MNLSILLDSSYVVTLVDSSRKNHLHAKNYYKHLLQIGAAIHLSTIAISELSVRHDIRTLPMGNFRVLPFSARHGIEAGRLWNLLKREESDVRHVVRDDVKLIAQASIEGLQAILTDDQNTFYKHCERLRVQGHIRPRAVKLSDGFDASFLNFDGQMGLELADDHSINTATSVEGPQLAPRRIKLPATAIHNLNSES